MSEKDREITEWKDKHTDLAKAHGGLQKQVDSLQRYFEDRPTADEHNKMNKEISFLTYHAIMYNNSNNSKVQ